MSVALAQSEASAELPEYSPADLGEGKLSSVGSDSMDGLVGLWVDAYREYQPQVVVQVVSRGSATAPAALIEGTADIGPMARTMKANEVEVFRTQYGFEPTQIRTALSGVAVYVSKDNPISQISFDDLDAIYSAKRKRGAKKQYSNWSDLGVAGQVSGESIMPLGSLQDSYPYSYFRQSILLQAPFVKELASTADSRSMFEAIGANLGAIAFGEVLSKGDDRVKALPVSKKRGDAAYQPSEFNMLSGKYPLARFLNVYVVRYPGKPLDSATADFLRFVLSKQGQQVVAKQGLRPLPAAVVQAELGKLN